LISTNFHGALLLFTYFGNGDDFSMFWVLKSLRDHAICMWHSREVKEVIRIAITLVLKHSDFAVFEVWLDRVPIFGGRDLVLLLGSLCNLDNGVDITFLVSFTVNVMPRTEFSNHHKFHSHISTFLVILNQLGIKLSKRSIATVILAQIGYTIHV